MLKTKWKSAELPTLCFGIALVIILPLTGSAQVPSDAKVGEAKRIEVESAQQLLNKVREALGGEDNLKAIRSLSLSGKYRRRDRGNENTGEIKIDLLASDKFLKIEESNPRPMIYVTLTQAVNGDQVWIDRKVNRPLRDDGSGEVVREQPGRTSPIANETTGMRGTTSGRTTVRTNPPGARTRERSVLGMPLPSSQGPELNNPTKTIEEDSKAASQRTVASNRPPGIENPAVRSAMEKQILKEFACLQFALLLTPPSSFPLELTYAGQIEAGHGKIEAIEISGPAGFAARLFVDQSSHLPVMLSYREILNRKAGYVVSAERNQSSEAKPEDIEEIAVQLYFFDYRRVNGVALPYQITKAVSGVPVDEWKIDKYKVNPDLKPKRFEKK